MWRREDEVFVLGTEQLDAEPAGVVDEPDADVREQRDLFSALSKDGEEAVLATAPPPPRSQNWLLAGLALGAGAASLALVLVLGGEETRPYPERPVPSPPAEAVIEPASSEPHRSFSPRVKRRLRAVPPRRSMPARRPIEPRREPASEPVPTVSPIVEPVPSPVSALEPVGSPADPSPSPSSGGGQGGRPEFSFER